MVVLHVDRLKDETSVHEELQTVLKLALHGQAVQLEALGYSSMYHAASD